MKIRLAIIFLGFLCTVSCKKIDVEYGTQQCVFDKILGFRKFCCDSGANVKEYLFQNKTVFVFEMGNCGADFSSEVIDAGCQTLGYLGGFSGSTMINGLSFSNAIYQKVIWEN